MVPLETKSKYVVHLGEFPFYQGSVVLIVAPSTKGIPPTLLLQPGERAREAANDDPHDDLTNVHN
jgi:hypothetical protein